MTTHNNTIQAGSKVAFNTLAMYAKVVITVGVTLYSTRIILNELGEDDFGAFNLIAGIVGMLAFFNTSVCVSIQRYMSQAMGMNDKERFYDIFRISVRLGFLLGILMVIVIETLVFFFFDQLNIAPDRMFASKMVLHCIVASTFFSIISIPYEASIFAHEDMFLISLLFILESFLKLGIAIYLIYSPFDKLIVYGLLMAAIYMGATFLKRFYCRYKYDACRVKVRKKQDRRFFFEIARFSGWTSVEPLSRILSTQVIAVILNIFGGTVINAAYGIANQVNAQMIFFSTTFLSAINPQIMKSEGQSDRERTARLSLFACKISFLMLSFFTIPLIIEMPYILDLWLKDVPGNTVLFCRIILFSTLISQLTYGLQSGIQAVGRIRNYQIISGIIKLLVLLITFILFKSGLPLYIVIFSFVIIEIINLLIRSQFAIHLLEINGKRVFIDVFLKPVLAFLIIFALSQLSVYVVDDGFIRLIITIALSSFTLLLATKFIILNKDEYRQIKSVLLDFSRRIRYMLH
jgi:Na+-driven multidrug efflux pump